MSENQHAGDSSEQLSAESEMLELLGRELGTKLSGKNLQVFEDAQVQIDGVSEDPPILCEAFAHQGSLKPGQRKKVITDAFKLLAVEKALGSKYRKIILFANDEASKPFMGKSWYSRAFSELGIDVITVKLSSSTAACLRGAQQRQVR